MVMWEDIQFTPESSDSDAQLYDRSVRRYAALELAGAPSVAEFAEVYSAFRSHLYEANRLLFLLDALAEAKCPDQLHTPDFDKMRESLDKCAERLQWATERGRKMQYFLRKLLSTAPQTPGEIKGIL